MDPLARMAESKIKDAIDDGVFDDLPGKGKPLELPDDAGVPAELRGAYIALRTAGMLPEEMELRKSMVRLRDLIEEAAEGDDRALLESRLRDTALRYDILIQRRGGSSLAGPYRAAAAARLAGRGL